LYLTEPKSKKLPIRLLGLLIAFGIGFGLLWWQRDHLPAKVAGLLPQPLALSIPPATVVSTAGPNDQVKLVYAAVVTPENDAFMADFYLDEVEHHVNVEWMGINGRTEVETYVVQPGDTLWGVATKFGLDIDTLRWSNPDLESNPDLLPVGSELIVLPVIGAYHAVVVGETLESIAAQYGVAEADIINYPLNHLSVPYHLEVGDKLIIPNGRKDLSLPKPNLDPDYPLAWPISGRITQGYQDNHPALDLGAPYGSKVYAADAGTVIYTRWARTGYGFTVIIDHSNNLRTIYSHLKGALVESGTYVKRGQTIGEVGSTGNSTGPHVHFEVLEDGEQVNPLNYLK
jgi:LysM repeat protein